MDEFEFGIGGSLKDNRRFNVSVFGRKQDDWDQRKIAKELAEILRVCSDIPHPCPSVKIADLLASKTESVSGQNPAPPFGEDAGGDVGIRL